MVQVLINLLISELTFMPKLCYKMPTSQYVTIIDKQEFITDYTIIFS